MTWRWGLLDTCSSLMAFNSLSRLLDLCAQVVDTLLREACLLALLVNSGCQPSWTF